jgi:hypothetical protein
MEKITASAANPATYEANTRPRGGIRPAVFARPAPARPVPAQEVVQRSTPSDLFVVAIVSIAGIVSAFMAVFMPVFISVFMALSMALFGALFVRVGCPWRLWRGLFLGCSC